MKIKRQSKIVELVQTHDISTQEELSELLMENGYNVTQATISRDIRELKLTKVTVGDKQKYAILQNTETGMNDRFVRVLKGGLVSMDMAQNILVINTISGMAMAVCAALDAMQMPEIVGTIGGDDTIMCVCRTTEQTADVMNKIHQLVKD